LDCPYQKGFFQNGKSGLTARLKVRSFNHIFYKVKNIVVDVGSEEEEDLRKV